MTRFDPLRSLDSRGRPPPHARQVSQEQPRRRPQPRPSKGLSSCQRVEDHSSLFSHLRPESFLKPRIDSPPTPYSYLPPWTESRTESSNTATTAVQALLPLLPSRR